MRLDEAIKICIERMESGEINSTSEEYEALQVMTDYCKRGVEIGEACPKEREESYYHQNHWKASVYNEGRADIIHWVNSRLS